MDSIDVSRARARRAYEIGRIRLAVLGALPIALAVVAATSVATRPDSTLVFGLIAVGMTMLWYGRDLQRAVLPGFLAGLVPLVLALCANRLHACGPDGCTSYCVPACALGGIAAGLSVASIGHELRASARFWLSASALALLTGSMGCACIGFSGVIGLSVGYAAGVVPDLLRMSLGRKHP
jgi:hypothetical protein